ncbi:MAG: argininosuccinate synthase [Fimbriimonadaceae bacterium]|nr:argininosuccinate synthase [Fimbriimonadaceae bacterium]
MNRPLAALAFSGGLDTSFCVLYLQEQGYDVATITVDTGGFDGQELARIEGLAHRLGVVSHITIDGKPRLWEGALRFLVYGNVLRGQAYPLSVSAERICQAELISLEAKRIGAQALVHGSTGAGNDQIRFDVAFRSLLPGTPILTPIRSLALSRQEETDYLAERGITFPPKTTTYSVNEGMWGGSIGGRETLNTWENLPPEAFPGGEIDPSQTPREVTLSFLKGEPVGLDGETLDPIALVLNLNEIGRKYGIGRGYHLGDTILGIKGRIGYEAPAAHLIIGAHRELEKAVLTGKQLLWKESLGNQYGAYLHEGHFFDPICRDLEAFLQRSQGVVTGEVRIKIAPERFTVLGVRSPHSLMDPSVASYGEANRSWTAEEAAGFAKVFGLTQGLVAKVQGGDSSDSQ